MLIIENVAALIVFVVWVAAFALGYKLRNQVDATRAEFAGAFTYRQTRAHAGENGQTDGKERMRVWAVKP